jgi:hypothetical protein
VARHFERVNQKMEAEKRQLRQKMKEMEEQEDKAKEARRQRKAEEEETRNQQERATYWAQQNAYPHPTQWPPQHYASHSSTRAGPTPWVGREGSLFHQGHGTDAGLGATATSTPGPTAEARPPQRHTAGRAGRGRPGRSTNMRCHARPSGSRLHQELVK